MNSETSTAPTPLAGAWPFSDGPPPVRNGAAAVALGLLLFGLLDAALLQLYRELRGFHLTYAGALARNLPFWVLWIPLAVAVLRLGASRPLVLGSLTPRRVGFHLGAALALGVAHLAAWVVARDLLAHGNFPPSDFPYLMGKFFAERIGVELLVYGALVGLARGGGSGAAGGSAAASGSATGGGSAAGGGSAVPAPPADPTESGAPNRGTPHVPAGTSPPSSSRGPADPAPHLPAGTSPPSASRGPGHPPNHVPAGTSPPSSSRGPGHPPNHVPAGTSPPSDDRLLLHSGGSTYVLSRRATERVEAEGDYMRIHGERELLVRITLKELNRLLGPGFARVSRSAVVNLSRVRELRPAGRDRWEAVLASGERVPVTAAYREALEAGLRHQG